MLFPRPNSSGPPRRVLVTGVGIITALGRGWADHAEGFRQGRRAFRPVRSFPVIGQRTSIAAELDLPPHLPPTYLSPRDEARLDRAARMLLWAAHEAWTQAGWTSNEQPLPLVLGTTSGGMSLGEAFLRQACSAPPNRRGQATRVVHYQAQHQALDLMKAFQFQGSTTIIANACASGANAVGHAFELIRQGHADRVLVGGYDALSQLVFAGFDSLQALSTTQCRPFAADRDGLALGEGAAVLCLEAESFARQRGAERLGEIAGYGVATDVHHLTQPQPDGLAALATMTAACAQAGISPEHVGYVNAHGTGTPLNDRAEAAAINQWAGHLAPQLPVSSTKASIGHLLGAAGAVEVVVCLQALRGQWLPPEIGLDHPDPLCRFPLVTQPQDQAFVHALTNSFGFGGANASLVVRR